MVKQRNTKDAVMSIPEMWEIKKLKDVAPLQRGFDLPYSQMKTGIYPVVFSNGIGAYHSEYMIPGPGVVTGRSGTIGKVHFVQKNYWPHNTSLWVTDFHGNHEKYMETSGIAGISNGFSELSGARIAYAQAEAAIENGMVTNPETVLFYFQSYALISMVINAVGNLPAEAYFSEQLQNLIRHDKTGPISYLDTLRVFLRNSMSYSQTAEELYIHRSTVVDRISRIERELDVNLKDPDTRLQLEIILKAMEIEAMVQQSRE